ncbi:MAG: hypothetical protein ACXW6V_26295 [Candidatus Binatia bacterium]
MNNSESIVGVEESRLASLRKILLAILALGMIGAVTELILLKHTEDIYQWTPLVLLGVGLPVLAWQGVRGDVFSLQLLRWLMCGFVAAGIAGVYFHFQGSAEFKLESQPNLAGMALFWAAIGAKAPPLLAPGSMVQLGLLGLAYTYKHPALKLSQRKGE